jgi:hypothetical protein
MINAWCDTRLLIVDECSFALSEVFKQICKSTWILIRRLIIGLLIISGA